jgi:hypothetical protein
MKNSEEAIEKVVAGLRDAEAPVGMERRILSALEERESAGSGLGWRRMMPVWLMAPAGAMSRVLVCGAALAGVVVAFAIPAIRRAGDATVHSKKEVAPAKLLPVTPSVVDAPSVAATSSDEGRAGLRVGTPVGDARSVRTIRSEDSVALSEMQAASFPAPPMPLTEQERLLLRIAHKNDPVEVAMLDPKQRNLEEMKERAEYQSFFARPVIEQPTVGETAPEQAVPASDPAQGTQLERQQQVPSGDDNKKNDDKSKNNTDDNGKNKGETE